VATCTKKVTCAGKMDRKITIFDRNILPPGFANSEDVDANEIFNNPKIRYAQIKTLGNRGITIFDSVGIEKIVTHEFIIRFDITLTSENWIEYNGSRYDIVGVFDLNEKHRFTSLKCIIRGSISKEATKA